MTTFIDLHRSDFNLTSELSSAAPFDADILWRDAAGDNVLWLMNNNTPSTVATLPLVTPDWHFKAAANFDAGTTGSDIDADILWQNDNGSLALWQMNGTTVSAIHALPDPGPTWHVVADDDFNGDTGDDVLFQNDNGALAMWTGISAATGAVAGFGGVPGMLPALHSPGPTWHVVGTGDINGDQRAAILWQNNNGALALWENSEFAPVFFDFSAKFALPTVDPSWHVKGMADLNHDNRADIVFQNDSGAVAVWDLPAGSTPAVDLVNINPGPAWHIAGLRDIDGDGRADILFQNDNGAAAVWENFELLGAIATFDTVLPITPNPNPNGHVWDLL